MKFPFVNRARHEKAISALSDRLDKAYAEIETLDSAYEIEIRNLRQSLLEARNESATLRGKLVAAAHSAGVSLKTLEDSTRIGIFSAEKSEED